MKMHTNLLDRFRPYDVIITIESEQDEEDLKAMCENIKIVLGNYVDVESSSIYCFIEDFLNEIA